MKHGGRNQWSLTLNPRPDSTERHKEAVLALDMFASHPLSVTLGESFHPSEVHLPHSETETKG